MSGSKKRARSRKNGNRGKGNGPAPPPQQAHGSTSSEKLSPPLVPQHHHFAPTPSMAPPSSSLVPPTGLGNTTYVSHSMLGHRLGLLGPPSSSTTKDDHKASGGAGGLKRIRAPHPHDVLCGRGGGINSHPGNRTFRDWVRERKESYNLAPSKAEKARIAREIVNKVRDLVPSGRFLAREGGASNAGMPVVTHGAAGATGGLAGFWVEIDDVKAMAKTSQALREGAPSIRAQHKAAVAGGTLSVTGKVVKGSSTGVAPVKGKSGAKAANAAKTLMSGELKKLKDQAGVAVQAASDQRRQQRATKKSTAIRPKVAAAVAPILHSSGRKPAALPQPAKLSPTSTAQALGVASEAVKQSAPGSAAPTTKKEETASATKEEKEESAGKRLLPPSAHNPPVPPPPPPPLLKGPALSSVFDSPHPPKRQKWSINNLRPGEESDSRDDFDSEAKMNQLLSLERSIAPTPPMTPPQPGASAFSLQGKTPKLMPMSPPLGSMHGHFYGLPSPSLNDPALSMMFANNLNHMPLSPLPTPTSGAGGAASGGVEFNVNGRKSRARSNGGNMNRTHSLELEASLPDDKLADDSESEFTDPFENDTELLREAGLGHDAANPHNGSLFYGKNGNGNKSGGEKKGNKEKSSVKSNEESSNEKNSTEKCSTEKNGNEKNEKNSNVNQGENKNPGDDKASGPKGTFRKRTTSSSAGSHRDMGGLKALSRQVSNKSSRSLTSDLSDLPDPNAHLHDDVDFNEGMKAVYDAAHPGLTSPRDGDSIPTYLYPLRGGSKGSSKCVSPLSGNLRHHKISITDMPKPAPTHRSISPSPVSSPIQARAMHGRFNDNWWTSFPYQ